MLCVSASEEFQTDSSYNLISHFLTLKKYAFFSAAFLGQCGLKMEL